jgi:lipopolysaccharide/colanic/teichoic acid biosynthesis glycosyltransferase
MSKRLFDLAVVTLSAPIWLPALVATAVLILVFDGRPILYPSCRRVHRRESALVYKFRVMVRNAATVYNRATVTVKAQRFFNTPINSPLYTTIGRLIERCQFTELPQIFNVISGTMSLVGSRPLPENVIVSLREVHPMVEERFLAPCGLTGLVQLIGRDEISDHDRLILEILYCEAATQKYSARMDFQILLFTVLIHSRLMRPFTLHRAHEFIDRFILGSVNGAGWRGNAEWQQPEWRRNGERRQVAKWQQPERRQNPERRRRQEAHTPMRKQ